MKELVIVGFGDRDRALEVLPQLKRLHFSWSSGLQDAVAVEVESDGRLKLFQGVLLDADPVVENTARWQALLGVLRPVSFRTSKRLAGETGHQAQTVHWFDRLSLKPDFVRNATALLMPDTSAVMAIIEGGEEALGILAGYSDFVVHTDLE
jgi:uncharacterized membrane protein